MVRKYIYKVMYDLQVYSGPEWYCKTLDKWISNEECDSCLEQQETCMGRSNMHAFSSKAKAMKEFNRLTELGIDCVLSDRKVILGKGWYCDYEWYSKEQEYFGIKKEIDK